jgi:hypothetical protein
VEPSVTVTIGVLGDERVHGLDGCALAVVVAAAMYDHAELAFLANVRADGAGVLACAAAVAADAPLLLTDADALPHVTAAELHRLGVRRVAIVGGADLVSPAVEGAVADLGIHVERTPVPDADAAGLVARLVGSGRLATSVALALSSLPASTAVFVASGSSGVVLRAPDAVPVPAGRVIDALGPSLVAVLDED